MHSIHLRVLALTSITAVAHAQTLLYDLRGNEPADLYGAAIAGVGDVDGDGFDDVLIGTHDNVPPLANFARVVSGRTGAALYELADPAASGFGFAVGAVGDLDHDGFADFLVGAPFAVNAGVASGAAYAYSGRTGTLLFTWSGDQSGDEFGGIVTGVGDVDADGFDDIGIGAYYSDVHGDSSGLARIVSGANGAVIRTFEGSVAGELLGSGFAPGGDLDGDGFGDVLLSAPGDDVNGLNSGRVFAYSCRTGALIWERGGSNAADFFGRSIANLGDLTGDGLPEFAIGAPFHDASSGTLANAGSVVVLRADGSTLFEIDGTQATAQLGFAVSSAGDVDQDGVRDFAAGANLDDAAADVNENSGSARVYSGVDGHELRVFRGASGERIGAALANARDVNGDGVPDLAVGGFATTSSDMRGIARIYAGLVCAPCFPVGVAYCFGHGGDTPCPCGNASAPGAGQGCRHSLGSGARLDMGGIASVANDTLIANGSLLTNAAGVYIQGTLRVAFGEGAVFGDGLRCAGGSIIRLATKTASGGTSAYPTAGDAPISLRGNVSAGDVRHYQLWFRNSAAFCTPAVFNLTNGVSISWTL